MDTRTWFIVGFQSQSHNFLLKSSHPHTQWGHWGWCKESNRWYFYVNSIFWFTKHLYQKIDPAEPRVCYQPALLLSAPTFPGLDSPCCDRFTYRLSLPIFWANTDYNRSFSAPLADRWNGEKHFLRTYCVPSTKQGTLYILSHLIVPTILQGKY